MAQRPDQLGSEQKASCKSRSVVSIFSFGRKISRKQEGSKSRPSQANSYLEMEEENYDQSNYSLRKLTFIFVVILPSTFAAIYYCFFATAQYIAEARFIVRTIGISEQFDKSEDREGRAIIGGDSLNQDAYIVANYLVSPQLIEVLDQNLQLYEMYSSTNIDYFSRLTPGATAEELHVFWRKQIYIDVDGPSGIITFGVRTFSSESSVKVNLAAMEAARSMIDALSERAKSDIVTRAEDEVKKNLTSYQDSLTELRNYQNKVGIFDPLSSAKVVSNVIASLIERKLQAEANLSTNIQSGVGNSVESLQLKKLISALESQIESQRKALTDSSNNNGQLSELLLEFSRLETQKLVSEELYKASVRNLDTAKSTALRRTTFLAIFSPPQLPQESLYPRRFTTWLVFFMGLLTLWTIATLIVASVNDHRN